jgi:hypothetical protein
MENDIFLEVDCQCDPANDCDPPLFDFASFSEEFCSSFERKMREVYGITLTYSALFTKSTEQRSACAKGRIRVNTRCAACLSSGFNLLNSQISDAIGASFQPAAAAAAAATAQFLEYNLSWMLDGETRMMHVTITTFTGDISINPPARPCALAENHDAEHYQMGRRGALQELLLQWREIVVRLMYTKYDVTLLEHDCQSERQSVAPLKQCGRFRVLFCLDSTCKPCVLLAIARRASVLCEMLFDTLRYTGEKIAEYELGCVFNPLKYEANLTVGLFAALSEPV